MSHHFQVLWVDTHAVTAFVIYLLFSWNDTMLVGVHHTVNSHGLTIQTHARVSTSTTISRMRALPNVTGCLKTEISYNHKGIYFFVNF